MAFAATLITLDDGDRSPDRRAISGRQAVEAAREMREAIEGKAPTQPSEQPVAQTVNNTIILNSIIEKLLGDDPL